MTKERPLHERQRQEPDDFVSFECFQAIRSMSQPAFEDSEPARVSRKRHVVPAEQIGLPARQALADGRRGPTAYLELAMGRDAHGQCLFSTGHVPSWR